MPVHTNVELILVMETRFRISSVSIKYVITPDFDNVSSNNDKNTDNTVINANSSNSNTNENTDTNDIKRKGKNNNSNNERNVVNIDSKENISNNDTNKNINYK